MAALVSEAHLMLLSPPWVFGLKTHDLISYIHGAGILESGDHITQVRPGGMWPILYTLSTRDRELMKGRPF